MTSLPETISNRPKMGLTVPPPNKGSTHGLFGLDGTKLVLEAARGERARVPTPYRWVRRLTQAEFCPEDFSTPSINRTPATPSSTPGTRSDDAIGSRPASLALICSAKSA